jgi:(2Fe-2S) ferredoxin
VLVCKGGDCKKKGSKDTRKALRGELRAQGINSDVRVDSVDCLGLCKHGPNLVVYGPNGASSNGSSSCSGATWYLGLDEEGAIEVAERHLKGGEPVERLAAEVRERKR